MILNSSVESPKTASPLAAPWLCKKVLITLKVTTHFFQSPFTIRANTSFWRSTDLFRMMTHTINIARHCRCLLVGSLLSYGLVSGVSYAAESSGNSSQMVMLEPEGILLNRTRSMLGQEFFMKFSNEWVSVPAGRTVNVVVTEEYSPRRGTAVIIFVEEKQAFRVPLSPRKPVDEARVKAAKNAAARAIRGAKNTVW